MSSILIRNARNVITMDDQGTRIPGGSIWIEGPAIKAIGRDLPAVDADIIIDARDQVVYPGLVNCHHHLNQVLTRNIPWAQDCGLFDWLATLYDLWVHLRPEDLYLGALAGLGELLKGGCTTAADHFYGFPKGAAPDLFDWEVQAAQELGIRFHPTRGAMTMGRSRGGLPPDDFTQDDDVVLRDTMRVIERFHDPERYSMLRVGIAPCAPFNVTTNLLRESARLARAYGVRLHTHLAETLDEERYCQEVFGCSPLSYLEQLDWLGADVWYAHGIHLNDGEIARLGGAGTGIAHCAVSNMKLSSGICRVPALLAHGVPVGLGVDGSASADSSNLLFELRCCYLMHKLGDGAAAPTAEQVLGLATRGGARVLGRDDIGSLEPGKAADLFLVDTRQLAFAGALHDDAALIVLTGQNLTVNTTVVNGRVVVKDGRLVNIDEEAVARRAQAASDRLLREGQLRSGIDYRQPRPRQPGH